MDSGKGSFEKVTREQVKEMERAKIDHPSDRRIDRVFYIGEEVYIRDSVFKVRSIDHVSGIMTLKLLPKGQDAAQEQGVL